MRLLIRIMLIGLAFSTRTQASNEDAQTFQGIQTFQVSKTFQVLKTWKVLEIYETSAASDTLISAAVLPFQAEMVAVDAFNQIYWVDAQNIIHKSDSTGKELTRYSQNRNGKIAKIDATNPQKIMVWYRDFMKLVFLDRNLTELGELDLFALNMPFANVIALGPNGHLFLYDPTTFKPIILDGLGQVLHEGPSMQVQYNRPFQPVMIQADATRFVMIDSTEGLLVFNQFGVLENYFNIKNIKHIYMHENVMIIADNAQLWVLDMATKKIQTIHRDISNIHIYWIDQNQIIGADKTGKLHRYLW